MRHLYRIVDGHVVTSDHATNLIRHVSPDRRNASTVNFRSVAGLPLRHRQPLPRADQQRHHDGDVERIPRQPVGERRGVGAGGVEDHAGHPATERHADHRGQFATFFLNLAAGLNNFGLMQQRERYFRFHSCQ